MLLNFSVKNFFCFKEWLEISMMPSVRTPYELTKKGGVFSSICFKGANASGKTNALKALSWLSWFTTDSFTELKPEEKTQIFSFFGNKSPVEFYVEFKTEEIRYTYELSLSEKEVVHEKITRKKGRITPVFIREGNQIKLNKISRKEMQLRSNASVISTANQYEIEEISDIYDFFNMFYTNVGGYSYRRYNPQISEVSSLYRDEPDAFEFAKKIIRNFDTGITDIEIEEVKSSAKPESLWLPVFKHLNNDEEKKLPPHFQSAGTMTLYKHLYLYFSVLENGGVLVLDEFDNYLHPDILFKLVDLFENPTTNPHSAQFIFATHNTEILDLMGKYRVYLFNKEDNECFAYRLDELDPTVVRNDRPLVPLYRSGKIGGVPNFSGEASK